MSKSLLSSVSNYSIGNLLFSLAALISFPVITRLLTVEDYGLLALIGNTLTFIIALSKGGLQHATLRFYSEVKNGNVEWTMGNYHATVLYGMGIIGFIVTLLWFTFTQLAPATLWNNELLPYLFGITAILVFSRTLDSVLANILRAKEYTALYNIFRVIKRYATLAVVIIVLYFYSRDLFGLYVATIVVEITALIILAYFVFYKNPPKIKDFSPKFLRLMLVFGIPMLGYELASIALNIGDQYIIQWILGASALGPYAAAYNFSNIIFGIIVIAFSDAVMPMYLRIWADNGKIETQKFITQALYYYFLISLPIIGGISAVGPEILVYLASEKYSEGVIIIPYIVTGFAVNGSLVLVAAGIFIQKKSKYLMLIVLSSAVINVVLNILLIPIYGIKGAAIATLVSYFILIFFTYIISSKMLTIKIPWVTLVKFGFVSFLMFIIVSKVDVSGDLFSIFIKVLVGCLFYITAILTVDNKARTIIKKYFMKSKSNV